MNCALPLVVSLLSQLPHPDEPDDTIESPWTTTAGLGLVSMTGNTNELILSGDVLVEYYTARWVLTLEADGAYGTAAGGGEEDREVVAEKLGGWARGEYRFIPVVSVYAYTAAETDHFASLELRFEAEAGLGFTLIESPPEDDDDLVLRLYVGAHFGRDNRFQYYPTAQELPEVDLWSPGLGLTFRYDVNDRFSFTEYAWFFPNVIGRARVLFKSDTKLAVHMTRRLALATHFVVESDSVPAQGKVPTDTSLTLGFELIF